MRSRKSDSDEIELAMSNKSFVISHRKTKRTGNKTRPRIVFAKFFFSSGQLVKLHKNQFTPEKSNLQACLAGFSSRLASRTSPKSLGNWDFRDEVKKRLKSALNARPLVRRLFTPEIKILLHCRWNTNFLCVHERRRKKGLPRARAKMSSIRETAWMELCNRWEIDFLDESTCSERRR